MLVLWLFWLPFQLGEEGCLNYSLLLAFILSFISVSFVPSLVITFSGGLSALSVGHWYLVMSSFADHFLPRSSQWIPSVLSAV